jgi:hypothetical protein
MMELLTKAEIQGVNALRLLSNTKNARLMYESNIIITEF